MSDAHAAHAAHASAEGALGKQAVDNRGKADTDQQVAADAAAENRQQADADQVVTVGLLEKIADRVTSSSDGLTAAVVARDARDDRTRRRFVIATFLSLVTIALIGLVALGYLHGQSKQAERAAEQRAVIAATQAQLASCSLPTGRCFKENERRRQVAAAEAERQRAAAVATIGRANAAAAAAAAACAQTHTGYPAIKQCVDEALK